MKLSRLFLFALTFLFAGCSIVIYRPPVEARLTPLPTPPHNRPVKIFFPGEALPTVPYVKIKVLSVKRASNVPTTNLVQELAVRAQQEGADAILVFVKNVYGQTETSSSTVMDSTGIKTTTSSSTSEWQDVSALAIKYLTNLDYLPDYVREKRLFRWNANLWQPVATGRVSYNSPTTWQPASATLLDLWLTYDPENILWGQNRGRLRYSDGYDDLRVSNWFSGPTAERKYRLRQNEAGVTEVVEARVLRGLHNGQVEKIRYRYDDQGRQTGRQIESLDWGTILEKGRFDETGKLTTVEWTRDGKPFLKMQYVYYQPEDVSEFLN